MAKAILYNYETVDPTGTDDFLLSALVFYRGAEVTPNGGNNERVMITFNAADTLAVMKNKIVTAIIDYGASVGWTVAAADIVIPSYIKGN